MKNLPLAIFALFVLVIAGFLSGNVHADEPPTHIEVNISKLARVIDEACHSLVETKEYEGGFTYTDAEYERQHTGCTIQLIQSITQ